MSAQVSIIVKADRSWSAKRWSRQTETKNSLHCTFMYCNAGYQTAERACSSSQL